MGKTDRNGKFYEETGMIEFAIPGYRKLRLNHLVLDYNGTLACDGNLIDGVGETLEALSTQLELHVLTADTFGNVKTAMAGTPCRIEILPPKNQDIGKLKYVEQLGLEQTVCIGNGRNDRLMLKEAALGIAVFLEEGAAAQTIVAADVVVPDILDALNLLSHPQRLVATLRS
jgi:soluble P-type ATPase